MKKILKTMLPVAGVACVAAPLITMTSCSHDCKYENDTQTVKFEIDQQSVTVRGFKFKEDSTKKYTYEINLEVKPTGTTHGFSPYDDKKNWFGVGIDTDNTTYISVRPAEHTAFENGDYFTVSFGLICKEGEKVVGSTIETLKAINQNGDVIIK